MKRFGLLSLMLFAFISSVSAAAPTVLMAPFENSTGDASLRPLEKGAPDLIAAFLAPQSDRIQIVDRDDLERVMAEHSSSWEQVMTPSGAQQAGRLVQAKYLFRGSITGTDGRLTLQGMLYETATSRLVKTFEATGARKDINGSCQTLADGLAAYFSAPAKPLPALPVEKDPETNLHLVQGLGFYYNGIYAKAFPEFMKILQDHPHHADAMYWLTKSFAAGGLEENASLEAAQFVKQFPTDPRVQEMRSLMTQQRSGGANASKL